MIPSLKLPIIPRHITKWLLFVFFLLFEIGFFLTAFGNITKRLSNVLSHVCVAFLIIYFLKTAIAFYRHNKNKCDHWATHGVGMLCSETLSLVYLLFAAYYILEGSRVIYDIVFRTGRILSNYVEGLSFISFSATQQNFYDIFWTYIIGNIGVVFGLVVAAVLIGCSRAFFMIHELDHGAFRNNDNSSNGKRWPFFIDWAIRIFAALAFIVLEKKIYWAGRLGELGAEPSNMDLYDSCMLASNLFNETATHAICQSERLYYAAPLEIGAFGILLYITLLTWSGLNAKKTRIHTIENNSHQAWIQIWVLISSLLLMISSGIFLFIKSEMLVVVAVASCLALMLISSSALIFLVTMEFLRRVPPISESST